MTMGDTEHPRFWYALGNQNYHQGQYDQAIDYYAHAIELKPSFKEAYNNLGLSLFRTGRHRQALQCFQAVIRRAPQYADAYANMGIVLEHQDRLDQAKVCYQKALEIDPESFEANYNLGMLYEQELRLDRALKCYFKALKIKPDKSNIHINIGSAFLQRMDFEKSINNFKKAFEGNPESLTARSRYLLTLPVLYPAADDIARHRKRYENGLDCIISQASLDTQGGLQQALALLKTFTPFYLQYQGGDDLDLQTRYGDFVHRVMAALYPHWTKPKQVPGLAPGEKIRIGYVSSYMHRHTVGKILIGWLRNHDHHCFEVHGYYIKAKVDNLTREIGANCDKFHHIPGDIEATARQITTDRLHLLIYTDIGMHPPATMLAAMRLAPIQCKAWGHPVTTGLPTMDYYLSSDLMEPEDGQTHYRETLVRLPNLALVHEQDRLPVSPKARRELGLPAGAFIYLSSQSLFKYLPQYDFVYPRIAQEVPRAHFVFIAHASPYVTRAFEERLKAAFQQYNLAFQAHCTIMPRMSKSDFLALNACCDTLLDTFEWSGGNTSMEGIACGLPAVVTCPGRFMRGRHTYAMLTMMGITDAIAENPEAYIEIAVKLANEPEFFQHVQSRFNAGRHLLFNDDTCVQALERFYASAVSDKLTGADNKHALGA